MHLFYTINETKSYISSLKKEGKSIGFVPTMGALHEGHLELVRKAGAENAEVVVSIFLNPIQFNNPEDFQLYPRTLEADFEKLKTTPCTVVFVPSTEEMYPEPEMAELDFGKLDKAMEGQFRPGHFSGVGIVVKKLFEIVTPDKAYFGEKDYQQLAIIKFMVNSEEIPVEIVPCPTVREADGLAMSSRNQRLTPEERVIAPAIYEALCRVKENYNWFTPNGVEKMIIGDIEQDIRFRVEYAQVVNADTLLPFGEWDDATHAVICLAVFLGQVRLIDNITLY
jgi:pantoate--beta-alanine ligase